MTVLDCYAGGALDCTGETLDCTGWALDCLGEVHRAVLVERVLYWWVTGVYWWGILDCTGGMSTVLVEHWTILSRHI